MLNSLILASGQKSDDKIKITGYVVDNSENPVANAPILVDGIKTGKTTDNYGHFRIRVGAENKTIGVLSPANKITEEPINGRNKINLVIRETIVQDQGNKPGNEAVDIGYEKVKKNELTSPVGKIDGTKSKYASYNSIYDMLKGEIPGVQVNGSSITIRNSMSFSGNNEPLIIVDGSPVISLENIKPQMVKSIEVLKGSSAAIYGVRGSNGVIIINLLK
jgi:TonB-dependent SusC/RagA subfamily outer membrane receptor